MLATMPINAMLFPRESVTAPFVPASTPSPAPKSVAILPHQLLPVLSLAKTTSGRTRTTKINFRGVVVMYPTYDVFPMLWTVSTNHVMVLIEVYFGILCAWHVPEFACASNDATLERV